MPVAVVIPKGIGAGFAERGIRRRRRRRSAAGGSVRSGRAADGPGPAAEGRDDRGARSDDAGRHEAVRAVRRRADAAAAEGRGSMAPPAEGGRGHARQQRRTAAPRWAMPVEVVDVMRTDDRDGSLMSFYAAGIGVMFLLFSAVGGAGGALLEEAESGTLERLLSTNIGMTGLLAGKWLFLTLVGGAAADGDVPLGLRGLRPAAVLPPPGFRRDDGGDGGRRRGARPRAGDARPHPRPALRLLDDPDPDDVGAGRQHVPAVPDERDDAEDGAAHVQRLGARRLPESVLAQRRALGAVAAGAGAERAGRDVPQRSRACWPVAGSWRELDCTVSSGVCALALAVTSAGRLPRCRRGHRGVCHARGSAGGGRRGSRLAAARSATGHA